MDNIIELNNLLDEAIRITFEDNINDSREIIDNIREYLKIQYNIIIYFLRNKEKEE